jgi:hypothetical protein
VYGRERGIKNAADCACTIALPCGDAHRYIPGPQLRPQRPQNTEGAVHHQKPPKLLDPRKKSHEPPGTATSCCCAHNTIDRVSYHFFHTYKQISQLSSGPGKRHSEHSVICAWEGTSATFCIRNSSSSMLRSTLCAMIMIFRHIACEVPVQCAFPHSMETRGFRDTASTPGRHPQTTVLEFCIRLISSQGRRTQLGNEAQLFSLNLIGA